MELIGPGNLGLLPRKVIYVVRKEGKRVELWKSRNTPSCQIIRKGLKLFWLLSLVQSTHTILIFSSI